MQTRAFLLAFALALLFSPWARASQQATPYLLGPDDVISVYVRNHTDLNEKSLPILQDGTVAYGAVGVLKAAGKSPEQLAAEIQTKLEETRNHCEVVVSVLEVHSRRARIMGAVKTPGGFDLKPNWRLMDLITMAGGLTTSKPGRVTGKLMRASTNEIIPLNIADAFFKPESEANVPLQVDDLVLLEERDVVRQIHVMGEVNKPGAYDLDENTTVVSLVSEASGATEKASLKNAYILRDGNHLPLNLAPALLENKQDDAVTQFKLEPGDVLFLPQIEERYAVLGQVTKPGYYPVSEKEPMTVLKALSLAGGQTQEGDLRKAGILHMVDGKPVANPINIEDMLKKGKLETNVVLKADDILFIPPKSKQQFNINQIWSGLSILNLLGFRFGR